MPTPTKTGMSIAIKASVTSYSGEKVKITNLTKNQIITATMEDGQVALNPKDTYTGWASGDSIQAEINGRIIEIGTGTLAAKGISLNLTNIATPATSASADYSVSM